MAEWDAAEDSIGEGAKLMLDHFVIDAGEQHLPSHDHDLLSPIAGSIEAMLTSKDGCNVPDTSCPTRHWERDHLGTHRPYLPKI
ncbi:hypothetical protein NKI94_07035 [Mesorhizobium australicum]